MKRITSLALIIVFALAVFDIFHIGYALLLFLIVGVIPGTNITLTPTQMMILMVISGSLVIYYWIVTPLIENKTKIQRAKYSRPKVAVLAK